MNFDNDVNEKSDEKTESEVKCDAQSRSDDEVNKPNQCSSAGIQSYKEDNMNRSQRRHFPENFYNAVTKDDECIKSTQSKTGERVDTKYNDRSAAGIHSYEGSNSSRLQRRHFPEDFDHINEETKGRVEAQVKCDEESSESSRSKSEERVDVEYHDNVKKENEFRPPAGIHTNEDDNHIQSQRRHFPEDSDSMVNKEFEENTEAQIQSDDDKSNQFKSSEERVERKYEGEDEKSNQSSEEKVEKKYEGEDNKSDQCRSAGIETYEEDNSNRFQRRHFAGKTTSNIFGDMQQDTPDDYEEHVDFRKRKSLLNNCR